MDTGNSKIDITLIILFLTVFAYGLAYVFEFAFQGYYQLPRMFIDLNINTLTQSLVLTISIFGLVCFLSFRITELIFKSPSPPLASIPSFAVLSFSLIALIVAFGGGHTFAAFKEEYIVLKQDKELFVVVTPYKDNLVIAPIDIKTKTMSPKFEVIEIKSLKDTEVIRFENGINVKDLETSKEFKKDTP